MLAIGAFVSTTTNASATVLDAIARGTVSSTGGGCGCYPVGFDQGGAREYRGYFEFDLTGISATMIYGATLSILEPNNPGGGWAGTLSTLTLAVDGYTGALNQLGGPSSFTGLGNGTVFGTVDTTVADNGQKLNITLNAAGIAALTAAEGGKFAFGGFLTGAANTGNNTIFQWSGYAQGQAADAITLTLDTVPEPASLAVLGAGLGGLGMARRRRASRA